MPSRGGDERYVAELGRVLRTGKPAALKIFLLDRARQYGDDRQVAAIEAKDRAELEALMHRMILARPDLADLHPNE